MMLINHMRPKVTAYTHTKNKHMKPKNSVTFVRGQKASGEPKAMLASLVLKQSYIWVL